MLFHDERAEEPSLAFMLARMRRPEFPEPIGVFRCIDRPTYNEAVEDQVTMAVKKEGEGDLEELFRKGDTWEVK